MVNRKAIAPKFTAGEPVNICYHTWAMRALLAISLLAAASLGCHSTETAQRRRLAQWHSEQASPKQRMEAASRLVPIGTKQVNAERILGRPTRTYRFYGPVIYAPGYVGPTNVTYSDDWVDFYDLKDGNYVCLAFDVEASRDSWEDRPLVSVSTGNAKDDQILITTVKK